MLWTVRTTLADRPGALAALADRCGRQEVNILGLQIFPGTVGVTDELVLRTPDEWGRVKVAALVESAGGGRVSVEPCTEHVLTDAPTRYVTAAVRLVDEPQSLQQVLDDLLDGEDRSGDLAALQDRLQVGGKVVSAEVRRRMPFTDTERARAAALESLAVRLLAREEDRPGSASASSVDDIPPLRVGQPADIGAVQRMHRRCSQVTLHRRFHAPLPRLGRRSASRLVYPPGGISLLADTGTEVVGMAVVAPYSERVMEVGLLVEDGWQQRGIGSALLYQAAGFAVSQGCESLLCVLQPDNEALLNTVRRSGLTGRLRSLGDTAEIHIGLRDVRPMAAAAVPAVPTARPGRSYGNVDPEPLRAITVVPAPTEV